MSVNESIWKFDSVISNHKKANNIAYQECGQVYEQAERGARKGFLKVVFRLTQNGTVISCRNFG